MKNSPKISCIIPVYNVEKYLAECIDSVLSSNEQDFEILLINDGSTDGSGDICNSYLSKDSRIRVFHQQNGGLSAARNTGLNNATGKWVFFLDSDDYIDSDEFNIPEGFEIADIIIKWNILRVVNTEKTHIYVDIKDTIYQDKTEIYRTFLYDSLPTQHPVWGKLLRREMIDDARFNVKDKIAEDYFFNYTILDKVKTYAFCSTGRYYYRFNPKSLSNTITIQPKEKFNIFFDGGGLRIW